MEYRIEKLINELTDQRLLLVKKLSKLDENLPNHVMKYEDLNNQISVIDMQTTNYLMMLKDIKSQELSNELTISQNKK